MIKFKQKGDFKKLNTFLEKAKQVIKLSELDKYGKQGVEVLKANTPYDSGVTASSWSYEIKREKERVSIQFANSNINKGVPIAIILQYGHGTKNGGWVEGRDYINPSVQPLFEQIAEEAWEEVIKT